MGPLFSSELFHPRDRFAIWHEVACKTIVQHSSTPDDPISFSAELKSTNLEDVGILDATMSPMMVERTQRQIDQADHDDFLLCLQRDGQVSFQGGKDLVLRAGDVTILDPTKSYVGHFDTLSNLLVVRLPRRALERRVGAAASLVLSSIVSSGDLELLTAVLSSIVDARTAITASASQLLRETALDLTALSLAPMLTGTAKVSNSRQRLKDRLVEAVHRKMHDPNFTGEDASKMVGISVRYANALLNDEDTSLRRLILSKRLQRCAQALSDPAQRHRSIQDIAFSWGFSDQSNFGRRFKEAYGLSPKDYRHNAS